MDKLPKKFIREGLELADGATLFGIPLEKLSREELIAAVAKGWKAYEDQLKEVARRREIFK